MVHYNPKKEKEISTLGDKQYKKESICLFLKGKGKHPVSYNDLNVINQNLDSKITELEYGSLLIGLENEGIIELVKGVRTTKGVTPIVKANLH